MPFVRTLVISPTPWRDAILGATPALLLALFALRAGTFEGATVGIWAAIGHATLIAYACVGAGDWRDPLRLGRRGNLLIAGLMAWVVVSCALSPVPRAGWMGVLLLPVFLLIPAATARCWSSPRRRTLGLVSLSVVLAMVAVWSLIAWAQGAGDRPAMPLGHHNLLAAFLVILLPTTVAFGLRHRPRNRPHHSPRRVINLVVILVAIVAVVALVATRSLTGVIALFTVALVALPRRPRVIAAILALAIAGLQTPRLIEILHGDDGSIHARLAYARAALDGIQARPLIGWGPGATPWTIAEHLPPRPGVLPAGQVVGHVHNLPLHLAYEMGVVGLILMLALATILAWRCFRARCTEPDRHVRRAAIWGLVAAGVASLGGLPLTVTVLPLAVAILTGLLLTTVPSSITKSTFTGSSFTGSSITVSSTPRPAQRWKVGRHAPAWIVLVLCAVGLARVDAAHLDYDRAVDATNADDQRAFLDHALRLDPRHSLYRARRAWLAGDANEAKRAAESARGVAALWLAAGSMGLDTHALWAPDALERVCRLDPLGPMAPFLLGIDLAHDAESPDRLARALVADPRLMAARAFLASPHRDAVATRVGDIAGIDSYWRDATRQRLLELQADAPPVSTVADAATVPAATLALGLDHDAATSLSLFAFRRRPWPTTLVAITLMGDPGGATALGAAADRRDTDPRVFSGRECTLGSASILDR